MIETLQIMVRKANGATEPFEPEKLRASLLHSGATEEAAGTVVEQILSEIKDGMTTGEIYRHAFSALAKLNKPVARSYSLRRAVMDLGPAGFSFEDLVAEILRAKGYTCETRQTVLGGCVPHEVDVVAYNKDKLVMVEAKFHNELGTKSDLKVVLYIKARFDDIKENVYDYGGKGRHVTDSWLVTNTKFSTTAIHYGECKNLTLIGWNYPAKGNLKDMIEEAKLHPVTALVSLSSEEKRTIMAGGTILCSDLKKDPSILTRLLGESFDVAPVIAEINEL